MRITDNHSVLMMVILAVSAGLLNPLLAQVVSHNVSCRNSKGEPVEWFIIYKVPESADNELPGFHKGPVYDRGTEFGYFDSTMGHDAALADGTGGIAVEKNNPLATSLAQIFRMSRVQANKRLTYIVYNDQPPTEDGALVKRWKGVRSLSSGHSKGVVVLGAQTGLWLMHSIPHFPAGLFKGRYSYPSSGHVNGQTAICVTFNSSQIDTVAAHLRIQQPHLYESSASEAFRKQHPELDQLLKKNFTSRAPFVLKGYLIGADGTKFTLIAKSKRLNEDIYRNVIAPILKSDIYVETWRNGPGGKLSSDCKAPYHVLDVENIAIGIGNKTVRWSSSEDHSKWALADNTDWICICSINRMISQFRRGGEAMCLQHQRLHKIFQKGIAGYEPCPKAKPSEN
ncbi:deoxyribonuclease-2-alpha-like [Tropilaelaps mercedesae]|uniref:Deoxyribonuclease-2-alpha-like n=1 Tax=Tropilaelaps mercedesae TaxID=418985 RepID=A0A1V9XCH1_9ACAR|nr:deoxyribonuclease-2-alpha-like [Tropilaelaps mercedesae]